MKKIKQKEQAVEVSKKQNAAEDTRIDVHMSPLMQDTLYYLLFCINILAKTNILVKTTHQKHIEKSDEKSKLGDFYVYRKKLQFGIL